MLLEQVDFLQPECPKAWSARFPQQDLPAREGPLQRLETFWCDFRQSSESHSGADPFPNQGDSTVSGATASCCRLEGKSVVLEAVDFMQEIRKKTLQERVLIEGALVFGPKASKPGGSELRLLTSS